VAIEVLNIVILFTAFIWMGVQFVSKGDVCDVIQDLEDSGVISRSLHKRCYIIDGIEICDPDASHSVDFGLTQVDKGCEIAEAASAIAGISSYVPTCGTLR